MRRLPTAAFLCAAMGLSAAGAATPGAPAPEASAAEPPSGAFTVVAVRRASGVAGGPIEDAAAQRVGSVVSFGDTLTWWDGTNCADWTAAPSKDPIVPLDDPNLSDTQVPPVDGPMSSGERRLNAGWSISCGGKNLGVVLQVDERVLVVPTPSGVTNLILEKPLTAEQTLAFQKQLKDMKFLTESPSESWSDASLAAVAAYAQYRGAKFRFARTAITENLLDGLKVLASAKPADDPSAWEEIKIVYNGKVAAHFWGEEVELAPREYGVRELRFTFEGDPETYVFKPKGKLYFSDWTFDIFSPDGDHVLLLQDRFGPWHLVPLTGLKDYLRGRKKPAHVIGKKPEEGPAGVHGNARWISPYELEYTVTCCGTEEMRRYNTRFPDYRPKETPDTLSDYRPSLSVELAGLPAARVENLGALIRDLKKWSRKADKSPGKWDDGHVGLGADPKEYVPSDAELVVAEIGDRISHIVANTDPADLAKAVRQQKIKVRRIVYKRFTFRHVDVMGSGRFFYASAPQSAVIEIGTD